MSIIPISTTSAVTQSSQSHFSILNNRVTKIFLGAIASLLSFLFLPLPLAFIAIIISFKIASDADKLHVFFGGTASFLSFLYLPLPFAFGATILSLYLSSKNVEPPNYTSHYSDNERNIEYSSDPSTSYEPTSYAQSPDFVSYALGPDGH
jgi:hypothetical protein